MKMGVQVHPKNKAHRKGTGMVKHGFLVLIVHRSQDKKTPGWDMAHKNKEYNRNNPLHVDSRNESPVRAAVRFYKDV